MTYTMYNPNDNIVFYVEGERFEVTPTSDVYYNMYDKKVYYAKCLLNTVGANNNIACGDNDSTWYYDSTFKPKVINFKKAADCNYSNETIDHYTWHKIKYYVG